MDSKVPLEPPPEYEPPSAPPPPAGAAPPPYPPPPGLSHTFSSANNATFAEADRADEWCRYYPLTPPYQIETQHLRNIDDQLHEILIPEGFSGTVTQNGASPKSWRITSKSGCTDTLLQTKLPTYASFHHSPLNTEQSRTVYFEIFIHNIGVPQRSGIGSMLSRHANAAPEDAGVAIGYFAPPYPPFRLPGWQRGSLAVHSDDGRRYVANPDGGLDFTAPFRAGETIGLGMTFSLPSSYEKQGPELDVEVFFTRDGRKVAGWNLLRDSDVQSEKTEGIEGRHDIFPAIGVFGPTDVTMNFGEDSWLYRGWSSSTTG